MRPAPRFRSWTTFARRILTARRAARRHKFATLLTWAGTMPPSSVVIGPNSLAIDSRLNLAVQVDQTNNRVLLVPLPQ